MILDQISAPNTMPVFGGEGYNRSPFAIPEDFVAYLFNNQQIEASSPMGPMNPQTYVAPRLKVSYIVTKKTLTILLAIRTLKPNITLRILQMM